jgi:hypothetical protein
MGWLAQHWLAVVLLTAYGAMLALHAWQGRRGTRGVSA